MAEDDDDEAFGEFASAGTSQPDCQFKGGAAVDDDDDEWGDFVKSPQQSQLPDLTFTGNHVPSPPPWVRLSGALPLSIFGDDDKEEEELGEESSDISRDFSPTLAPKDAPKSRDLGITDLYNGYLEIKPDRGLGPNSSGGAGPIENGPYSSRNEGGSAVPESKNADINQLKNKSNYNEFSLKPHVSPGPNENGHLFRMQEFTGFGSDLEAATPDVQETSSRLDTNGQVQLLDVIASSIIVDADNEWEFKDAFSAFGTEEVHNKVDPVAQDVSERTPYLSGTESSANRPLDLFETPKGSLNLSVRSTESADLVSTSSGISSTFQDVGFIGIQPNGFTSDKNWFFDESNTKATLKHSKDEGSDEFDEDFRDFTAASAENGLKPGEISTNGVLYPNGVVSTPNVKIQVDLVAHEVSVRSTYSYWKGSSTKKSLFDGSNGSINFLASSTPSTNAATSDVPSTVQEVDLFGLQPSLAIGNGITSETKSIIEQDNAKGLLKNSSDVGDAEFDEDFGEFTAASAETEPKPEEKDTKVDCLTQAFPFIFENEQPETDPFKHQPTSDQRNSTPTGTISVNDLISSLYSQPELTSFTNTFQEPGKTQSSISDAVFSSTAISHDDYLDDSSWSFEDALQMRVNIGNEDTSSKLKLNNYVDFYIRLKEELCFVIKTHFGRVKEAQNDAALSGEYSEVSLDSEFMLVREELERISLYGENNHQDHHHRDNLKRLVEVLLEPQFQILESEYHLSEKLMLVEKDLRSAVELLRHTITMIKILTIRKTEEQLAYISLWSEMISACLHELKHGASIWSQAKEKHVQSQLLTEPEGRNFFWAIGEIYRVVIILEASAKLFKPWMFSGSVESRGIFILLEESHAIWTTSGIREVVSTISPPSVADNTSLLESISHILSLDEIKLQNYVFVETESNCWLSILTEKVAPGMKMVAWENEQCFVTLANLWANLISRNPPKLPPNCFG